MTHHWRIIDLRCRPPAAGFATMAHYWDKQRIAQMGRDIGFEPAPCSAAPTRPPLRANETGRCD